MRCAKVLWLVLLFWKPSAAFGEPVDGFDYPTSSGAVTCDFNVTCAARNHLGIDLRARAGETVYAPANGVVREARSHRRYGATVIIEHQIGPTEVGTSVIGHMRLTDLAVRVGDTVAHGQVIGYAGTRAENGGWAPHIHWGVRKGTYNPGSYRCGGSSEWMYAGYTNCPETVMDQWYDPAELLERVFPDPTTTDDDGDGLAESEGDCDDTNPDIHPGAEEHCNGLDDNCANGVDEEPTASASCSDRVDCTLDMCMVDVHSCTSRAIHDACEDGDPCTTNLCLLLVGCRTIPKDTDLDGYTDVSCGGDDCDDDVFETHPDASERCNHADDNCDGRTDENWPLLGVACAAGLGVCRLWVCEPLERGIVCSAEYVSGTPEVCDDMDNDCDTETDESPAELTCDDGDDCTRDVCMPPESPWGLCYNGEHDCDGDTVGSDLYGGRDCNDSNPSFWEYTFAEEAQFVMATDYSLDPILVWTGSELGVAWSDDRNGNAEIYFARADATLTKIGGRRNDIRVTVNSSRSDQVSIVWTGSEYGLAWTDYRTGGGDIYFTRLDATGSEIGDDVRLTENVGLLPCSTPSISWTGDEYGVAYIDNRLAGDVYLIRLTASGLEIGSETPLVAGSATQKRYPSMVWTGIEYGLTWSVSSSGNTEVHFGRFTSAGSPIGSATVVATFPAVYPVIPALVWNGSSFALVWSGYTGDHEELYFTRIDASGAEIGSEIRITTSFSWENYSNPVLVWTGSGYGILAQDNSATSSAVIRFQRLGENGSAIPCYLPYPEFWITSYRYRGRQSMVWTGHEYVLAWADNRDGIWEISLGRIGCGW